jgi:FkbM family methyltransferase
LCVDVGANIGKYTQYLLENSESRVIAFEPLPQAFERLKTLQCKFGPRLHIENQGCSNESGHLELHYGSEISELASFSNEVNEIDYVGKSNVNSVLVQTTSLDDYFESSPIPIPQRCDLLKVDTEGFEFEVLVGATEFKSSIRPRVIQIEFNLHHLFRGHTLKALTQNLEGYLLFRLLPGRNGMTFCGINDFTSNIFQYSNYILVDEKIWRDPDFRSKFNF